MSRLIDADALLRDIEHYHLSDGKFQHWVEIQPTIERKTGKWIDITKHGGEFLWKCSKCGELELNDTEFCPNCGAQMEGEA